MVTDPNLDPYLDRQALDADIDPDPAKWFRSEPIQIRTWIHNTGSEVTGIVALED